jgi:lysozyme family protein
MKHPFEILRPEYSQLLTAMVIRPEKKKLVDDVAVKLCGFRSHYEPVTAAIGVPVVFIATSFEREGSSNFTKNPAQGWPLNSKSKIIPHNGPFRTWFAAAIAAYKIDGLDKIGAGNWTWEHICFGGESLNGFGYRDEHHTHTPYLWGGTNIQSVGKYVADNQFDPSHMDEQLGIIPVARRMCEIAPDLAFSSFVPSPISSGLSVSSAAGDETIDTAWVQRSINELGYTPPLIEDGSYGRDTRLAVKEFQESYGLQVDGFAGPETIAALREAVANSKTEFT